jgi:hypothetical protein
MSDMIHTMLTYSNDLKTFFPVEVEVPDMSVLRDLLSSGFGVSCKKQALLEMEQAILNDLEYDISLATASSFLDRFLHVANVDSSKTKKLAYYLLESTLYIEELQFNYRPSEVAAAVACLSIMNPGVNEIDANVKVRCQIMCLLFLLSIFVGFLTYHRFFCTAFGNSRLHAGL